MADQRFSGMPPATAEVACGGAIHRIEWRDGVLAALDHEHADAEHLFAALGGARSACETLLSTWRRNASNVRLLTVGPRDALEDTYARLDELEIMADDAPARAIVRARRGQSGPLPHLLAPLSGPMPGTGGRIDTRHFELLRLFCLPRPMLDRLLLEVATAPSLMTQAQSPSDVDVTAATAVRVRRAVAQWITASTRRTVAPSDIGVVVTALAAAPTTTLQVTTLDLRAPGAVVSCHVAWLGSIWARGLTLVDGHLATELVDIDDERAVVRALRPSATGELRSRTVALGRSGPDDRWSLISR